MAGVQFVLQVQRVPRHAETANEEEQSDEHLEKLVADFTEVKQLIKKKSMSSILTNAIKSSNDPEVKEKLNGKLIKLALDLDVE